MSLAMVLIVFLAPMQDPPSRELFEIAGDLHKWRIAQGMQRLADLARQHPESPELFARSELLRLPYQGRDKVAAELASVIEPSSLEEAALAWVDSLPKGEVRILHRDRGEGGQGRRGSLEIYGSPAVSEAEFARVAEVAAQVCYALEWSRAVVTRETTVVLVSERSPLAKRAARISAKYVDVVQIEVHDDGFAIALDLLEAFLADARSRFGVRALAAYLASIAGCGVVPGTNDAGLARQLRSGASEAPIAWLKNPIEFERAWQSAPAWPSALAAAGMLARRVFENAEQPAVAALVLASTPDPGSVPASIAELTGACPDGTLRLEHFGHACFRITAPDGTRLLVDPFESYYFGARFPWVSADAVAITHAHEDHDAIDEVQGSPLRLPLATEGVVGCVQDLAFGPFVIRGVLTEHDPRYGKLKNLLVLIECEGLRIVHLGDLKVPLEQSAVDALGRVDVLLAPIDDSAHILNASQLTDVVSVLKPRILVPMHYRIAGAQGEGLGGIDRWLAEQKNARVIPHRAAVLRAADLPHETATWVFKPPLP